MISPPPTYRPSDTPPSGAISRSVYSPLWDRLVERWPLDGATAPLDRITPHEAQAVVLAERDRFNVLSMGRRWGKTELGAYLLTESDMLTAPVAWFAPSYKYMIEVWRQFSRLLAPVLVRKNATERRMELTGGGVLDFWSLDDPDAGRGRKYKRAVVDEAAMIRHLRDAWEEAISATLIDLSGDAWFLSTPKGRNFFYELWLRGQGGHEGWKSWQMSSYTNPTLDPAELDLMRTERPEAVFRQEIMAEFLEDAGTVFRRVVDAVDASVTRDRAEPGHEYVFGVDWGKHNDFTVITVLDRQSGTVVHLDRFNQIDYQVQIGRLDALRERFDPVLIIPERNSMGEPLIEQLHARGWPVQEFVTTNQTKNAAVEALQLAFEKGEITLPAEDWLIHELQAYELERLPSGRVRYGAPPGLHDDGVMSLAFAWYGRTLGNQNWLLS